MERLGEQEDITDQIEIFASCNEDNPKLGIWGWSGLGPVHGIVKKKEPFKGRILIAARAKLLKKINNLKKNTTYAFIVYSDDQGKRERERRGRKL